MKLLVGPRGKALGVNALGYLPNVSRELGVTLKVVKELSIRSAKEPLTHGSEARLGRWPGLLRAFVAVLEKVYVISFQQYIKIKYHLSYVRYYLFWQMIRHIR